MGHFFEEDEVVFVADLPQLSIKAGQRAEVVKSNDDDTLVTVDYYDDPTYTWKTVEVPSASIKPYSKEEK